MTGRRSPFLDRGGSLQTPGPSAGRGFGGLAINVRSDVAGMAVETSGVRRPFLYRNGQSTTRGLAAEVRLRLGARHRCDRAGRRPFRQQIFVYGGHTSRFQSETHGWPRQSASAADLNVHGNIVGATFDYEGVTLTSRALVCGRDGRLGWMQGLGSSMDDLYAVNSLGQAVGLSRFVGQEREVPVIHESGCARSVLRSSGAPRCEGNRNGADEHPAKGVFQQFLLL